MSENLLKYFNNDELAASVWENKYAKRNINDELLEETPDDMHKRMAKEFARVEKKFIDKPLHKKRTWKNFINGKPKFSDYWYKRKDLDEEKIYQLFKDFKYIVPAGSVMSGLGSEKPVSLSNCFVLPSPEDSYSSINLTRLYQTELMKRRGGVGYDLSNLRPRGAKVNNAAITSTGAASFMDVCSDVTNEVAQQGRRGALMLSMNIKHPDIQEFIEKKQDLTKVTGANVSVQVTDEFMEAVEKDETYILRWPVDAVINEHLTEKANGLSIQEQEYGKLYNMIYGNSEFDSHAKVGYMKKVRARDLWNKLIHCAWNTAEPGIIFCDRMHNYSPDGIYPKYMGIATNPCVTGDTKVAVADGRGYVSFKELAEIGDDVDVFCLDDNQNIVISKMRNPRITGYNKVIYEITLEGGHKIKCTENHKILLNDKGYVQAKDLNIGDSVFLMTKNQMNWTEKFKKIKDQKKQPYNFITCSTNPNIFLTEHKLIYDYNNPGKNYEVIHHIDFNGLNNCPENLKGMSAKDHKKYHADRMKGKNNPIYKIKADPIKYKQYIKKQSENSTGENNSNCKHTLDEYFNEAVKFAKLLGRNFYLQEWLDYCKKINYPIIYDNFIKKTFGSPKDFIKNVAKAANVPYIIWKGKILNRWLKAKENGYEDIFIDKNETDVFIKRNCENCGKPIILRWDNRERSFCSMACTNRYTATHNSVYLEKMKKLGKSRSELYLDKNNKLIKFYLDNKNNFNSVSFNNIINLFKEKYNIIYDKRAKLAIKNIQELKESAKNYNHKIIDIKIIGNETVYNGTVDKFHNYFTGEFIEINEYDRPKILSINQLNCGEIYMSGNESCRLINLNLLSFVIDPFTDKSCIDKTLLYNLAYEAMRLGDDLVELENEAVSKIIEEIKDDEFGVKIWKEILAKGISGRRVGLGFTALADMIAALNIKFATEEGNKVVKDICKILTSAILDCQADMAIERGKFPDESIGLEIIDANEWYNFIKEEFPNQWKRMMTYGRRNICATTIPPAGSVSLMTRTTSGIEPLFMPYYTRRKKCVLETDRVDYVDKLGIKFSEYVVVHPQLERWAKQNMADYINNFTYLTEKEWQVIYKKSPWYESCAQDIDWKKRVELQGIIQQYYTQHSISSTVNLPNTVTEEEVSNIYMTAWKNGLKGITVYRDGCREGILVQREEKKEEAKFLNNIDAPKRPKTLDADFYVTSVKGEKFFVIVGLFEDKPYEVFLYKPKDNEKTNYNQHKGTITKVRRGYYTFKSDELIIENISSDLTNEEYTLSLMSSMLMRHGANIKFICKTVEKIDDNITSFSSAMRRILLKYVKEQVIEGEVCPDCGGKLVRENGCIHCIDCGWSKCG